MEEIIFQIDKILDVKPSVDPWKFCNRNDKGKFQITSKLYHWLNANQRHSIIDLDYQDVK